MEVLAALAIFFAVLYCWRLFYVRWGNIGFWQLAARYPDTAYKWMKSRAEWIVLEPTDPRAKEFNPSSNLVGPFKLAVPLAGGTVLLYANSDSIDASQREFLDLYGGEREKTGFPWLSWLAMLYPTHAVLWSGLHGASTLEALGYGFANLGYLLFASGILAGSFRALGFRYRAPTLIAAVVVWGEGTLLFNGYF